MAERSAAEQLKALVEAAEREARESREAVQRVAERADELSGRVDELAAGVAEAVAALKQEIEALRSASDAPPPAEDPGTRAEAAADDELIAEAEAARRACAGRGGGRPPSPRARACSPSRWPSTAVRATRPPPICARTSSSPTPMALLDEVYARAEARK